MAHHEHKKHAEKVIARVAVITVSDTRTVETDSSGACILDAVKNAGHQVSSYRIIKDEPSLISAALDELSSAGATDAVIINGGTGISKRDSTFDAVDCLLRKKLPGFGEIFRALSYREIGSAAIMSRATAGLIGKMIVFSMPGSETAVRLAMKELIIPELSHAIWEMNR